jgi:hypothetical protein
MNFGDLWANGTVEVTGNTISCKDWRIVVVDLADRIIGDLGTATTTGVRMT